MKKHKLLFVHSSDEMYGADRILLQIVERLDKKKFHPIVVLPNDVDTSGALNIALKKRNVKVLSVKLAVLRRRYFTPFGIFLFLWRLVLSTVILIKLIRRESIDLVHSHTSAVLSGAFAAQITKKPHVWQTLEIIVSPKLLRHTIAWMMPRFADVVVAASSPTRDHLCAGSVLNEEKSIIVHNGVELNRFDGAVGSGVRVREAWCIGSEQILVGTVGRIHHWKGQRHFLEAAKILVSDYSQIRFAIVGGVFPGQEILLDNLKEFVNESNMQEMVIFEDFRGDIPSVIDAFDIFVSPSTSPDPFPTVVLEAMALRKPVVANAHGGCLEMVKHKATGLLVAPEDPNEMAKAIEYLIGNPAERASMGELGRERLETLFSLEAFISRWTNIYTSCIEQ